MSISESGSLYELTNVSQENATMKQSNSTRNVRNTSTSSSALITRSRGNFPPILYKILAKNYSGIITWLPGGESFRIHSRWRLEDEVLPHYFRHKKFSSFQKQLSIYDFTYTPQSLAHESSYSHRYFKQGREDLIPLIIRVSSKVVQAITIMSTDSTSLIEDDSSDDGEDEIAITSLSKSKSSKTTTDMKSTSSSYSSIEKKESNHSTRVKNIPSNSPGSNHSYDISNSASLSGTTTQSSFVPLSVMIRGQDQTYHQVYQLVEPSSSYLSNTTINNSSTTLAPTTAFTYTQQATRQVAPLFPPINQRSLLNSVSQELTPPTTTATTTTTASSNSPVYIKDISTVIGNIVSDVLSTHTQNLKYSQSLSSSSSTLPEINSNTSYMQTPPSYTTSNYLNSHDHRSHTHDLRYTAPTNGSGSYNASLQEYTTVPIQSTSDISTASSPIHTVNWSTLVITLNDHISELFTNLSQQYLQLSVSQWQQLHLDVMNAVNRSIVNYIQNNTTTYMTSDNQNHSIEYIDPIMGYKNQPNTQYISDNTMYMRQSLHYPYTYPRNYSDTSYNDSTTNYYTQPIMTHDNLSTPYYISAYSHLYNTHPTTTPMMSKHSIDSEDTPGVHSTYVQSKTTSNNMRASSHNTYNTTATTTTTEPQLKPPNITTNMSHQSGGIGMTSMPIGATSTSHYTNTMNKGTKRKYNVLPK